MNMADEAARVVESFGRRVIVHTNAGERMPAELFGKRLSVVCGDRVSIRRAQGSGDVAKVVRLEPRQTLFARTDSRGRTEPLAANISLLVVIVAPEPAPDPYIADRYLAGAALAGVEGAVVVNKCELPQAKDPAFESIVEEFRTAGYATLTLSARSGASMDALLELIAGRTAMFVGQSGVGKSTLTNQLAPQSSRPTRQLSETTREGRHTTVSTALFSMEQGGELIDAPGVRDYAPPLVEDALVQVGWKEIMALAPQCRFNNCLHLREPGCAVIAGAEGGAMAPRRYESYKRLLNIMRGLAPDYERRR